MTLNAVKAIGPGSETRGFQVSRRRFCNMARKIVERFSAEAAAGRAERHSTMNCGDAAVIVDEAQLSKFVHEETYTRPRSSDHLCKRLLANFRDHRLGCPFLAEVRQQQEHSGQTFLARIEQLIDEIRFNADGPAQKMGNEHLGELRFLMNDLDNS